MTTPTASHTYAADGTYTVTLTVKDPQGLTASKQVSVQVANALPTASFTAKATNLSVAFDGSASVDPDGTIGNYSWDFGDNSAVVSGAAATTSHVYAAGTYTATLIVTENSGCRPAKSTQTVTVAAATCLRRRRSR